MPDVHVVVARGPLGALLARPTSQTWSRIEATRRFCVNVLSDQQDDVCRVFATEASKKFAGFREGVDGLGSDEVVDVQGVGVGGILRRRGCPQRSLQVSAPPGQLPPALIGERVAEHPVGDFGLGDGGLAAQGEGLRCCDGLEARVDFAVEPADEERGDTADLTEVATGAGELLEPGAVRVNDLPVAAGREDQGDVDAGTRGGHGPDGGDLFGGGGDLDEQVGSIDPLVRVVGGDNGAGGVAAELGGDFDRREPVDPAAGVVGGPETINAFEDHGAIARTVDVDVDRGADVLDKLDRVGIDMDDVGRTLEDQGVDSFHQSFAHLLETLTTEAHRRSSR